VIKINYSDKYMIIFQKQAGFQFEDLITILEKQPLGAWRAAIIFRAPDYNWKSASASTNTRPTAYQT